MIERRDFLTQISLLFAAIFMPWKLLEALTPKPALNFDSIALPLVRQVFGKLSAHDLMTIQPMSGPTAKVFYLDYKYAKQSF